jgi:carboxypeptidase PM20D1
METEIIGEASLLLFWRGTSPEAPPLMLTAHQDVVPPGNGKWTFDPFSGTVSRGRVWGRGTIDYKCGFAGMLEACGQLLQGGFRPVRTVLLAFGHDEEVGGMNGAESITRRLSSMGTRCSSVLDEGGYIHTGGSGEETAVTGIAEKGYASFRLVSEAVQCHASVPPERTAIGGLARAISILENLDFNDPPLPESLRGAMFTGTTLATTMISGGCKENVLPGRAEATVNTRPGPLSSVDSVFRSISTAVSCTGVEVELLDNASVSEPSGIADTETGDFGHLQDSIATVLGPSIPRVTGVFPAATDSRRYGRIADNTYRFLPVRLGEKGIGALHSIDESIAIEDYLNCVGFYAEYIRRASVEL